MNDAADAGRSWTSLEARVRELANEVHDPCALGLGARLGLADFGLLKAMHFTEANGQVKLSLHMCVSENGCLYMDYFESELRRRIERESWLGEFEVIWLGPAAWAPSDISEEGRAKLSAARENLV